MAAIIETNPFAVQQSPVATAGRPATSSAAGPGSGTSTAFESSSSSSTGKPALLRKAEGHTDKVTAVILLAGGALITASEDRTVRVWHVRDTGAYWPSVCHYCASPVLCADYDAHTRRLLVGQLSGVLCELVLAEDFNSLRVVRDYYTHANGANCVLLSLACEWVLSAGRDRRIVWQCSETGRPVGAFACESSVLALQFDAPTRFAFAGDFNGHIYVVKITAGDGGQLISKLSAHSGSVRSLAWDMQRQWLFSAATDGLIIVWDIGGRQGSAYELK